MTTPRQAVEMALQGGFPGKIPFTIYASKLPRCRLERDLRNRGLCPVERRVPVVSAVSPHVQVRQCTSSETGKTLVTTTYETPVGTVQTVSEPAGFTSWMHEKMFKTADDYKVIRFLVSDEQYRPCYEGFRQAEAEDGGDSIFRVGLGLEPLQCFVSGNFMDMQTFCYEWMDHRDEILDIAAVIRAKRLQVAVLIADSPASHANYGGNVTVEVIGIEAFRQYYIPCYNEVAEIFHAKGKKLGTHLDGNNKLIAADVAASDLDYIEAFTPAPDTDLTLAEARSLWRNKVLWLNFPSSLHLKNNDEIIALTEEMFRTVSDHSGILMGVTEDMPPFRHLESCRAIMDALDRIR